MQCKDFNNYLKKRQIWGRRRFNNNNLKGWWDYYRVHLERTNRIRFQVMVLIMDKSIKVHFLVIIIMLIALMIII
jgi:hypothetical protein